MNDVPSAGGAPGQRVEGPAHSLSIRSRTTTAASLALNGVPCIESLSVASPGPLSGAVVHVRLDGTDVPAWQASVEPMAEGGTVELDASGFGVPVALMRRSNERESVDVVATLVDRSGATLAQDRRRLIVLPASHWVGRNEDAPSLSAFVTPNSPAAHDLLRAASEALGARTGSPALDGYQSGSPERVQRIAEACYGALAARRVAYQAMQASFEDEGQKVRTLAEVVSDGLGNCLDLSVALAALLEAAGLVVVIVAGDGHAAVGFSTVGDPFPEPVHEGASALLNRMELGEVRLVESTLACAPGADFGSALARAEQWLRDVSGRVHVIDLHAARRAGYHPLPEVLDALESLPAQAGRPAVAAAAERPWEVKLPPNLVTVPSRPRTLEEVRLDGWKRRLLDLTLRNRLLNDRPDAGIPLAVSGERGLALALSRLQAEGAFRLLPNAGTRPPSEEAIEDEVGRQWLRSSLPEAELARRATKAWRDSVSSIEETGARSLFVALGCLEHRAEGRATPAHAPILLVPAELARSGRGEGFKVRAVAEDIVANAALIEHLRMVHGIDLGLLEDLTEDDARIDIPTILAHVRQRVRDLPGAVVHATAKLGNYSFKKLPLFHELRDRSAEVLSHPVVRSLLGRQATPELAAVPLASAEATETLVRYESMRLPLPADSSQVAAVASGAEGRTFVLQGPPGTGKSQTITNLMAECLARGKRVLFIAEKAAALEVVSRRLRQQGLGPFALDLHAEHASKPSFVAQVKAALEEMGAPAEPGARKVASEGSALDRRRDRLRAACQALHGGAAEANQAPRTGEAAEDRLTVFGAVERVLELAEGSEAARAAGLSGALDATLPEDATDADVQERCDVVLALAEAVRALPKGAADVLGDVAPTSHVSPEAARVVATQASNASAAVVACNHALEALARSMGCPTPGNLGRARQLMALADAVDASHPAAAELATMACAEDHAARLDRHAQAVLASGKARALAAALEPRFDRGVLALDHAALAGDLRAARGKFVLWRWLTVRRVRGMLARFARQALDAEIDPLLAVLEEAGAAAAAAKEAGAFATELRTLGEQPGKPLAIEATQGAIDKARNLARLVRATHAADLVALREALPASLRSGGFEPVARAARESMAAVERAVADLGESLRPQPPWLDDASAIGAIADRLARIAASAPKLPAWSDVSVARDRAAASGMSMVAEAILSRRLAPADADEAAEAELLSGWIRSRLRVDAALADCPSDRMDPLRTTLARLVKEYQEAVPKSLPAAVRDRIRGALDVERADPPLRQALRLMEEFRVLTTIRRPIRRVMRDCAPAITVLMPLVLASPLTAATLLPPEFPAFDLVGFDEASQVPVWDAACALSRARAAVVVGDSRQLPPTNFFERRDTAPADAGMDRDDAREGAGAPTEPGGAGDPFEVLDSLLDEAVASGLPQMRLLWHYRSRDERLIEFSNRKSYEGRLKTFPAAERGHPNLGVEFRLVRGIYDRGGKATNRAEAEAVVAEVRGRLLDPDASVANRSVGVVTFSEAQQTLVQDLLDEALASDPAFHDAFHAVAATGEGVFVKNLENVQGDERATMVFSICYGRDASGRLHHHFGPLSLAGGERRLNVAVTRAREKVVVLSSIRAADIDLGRCTAQGARDLRDYLAYAEQGTLPAVRGLARAEPIPEPGVLEEHLADALEDRGWVVALHVGVSRDYRVGIAVARRDNPGRWLLGIELDGAFHRSAPAVLDRDVVRGQVLRALGWDILRVSCLDVFRDSNAVVARIARHLQR